MQDRVFDNKMTKPRASRGSASKKKGKRPEEELSGTDSEIPSTPTRGASGSCMDKENAENAEPGVSKVQQTLDKHLVPADPAANSALSDDQLSASLRALHERLDMLASQEYIENRLKGIVTEEFLTNKLKEVESQMKIQFKKEVEMVRAQVSTLENRLQKTEETVEVLQSRFSGMEITMENLKTENTKSKSEIQHLQEQLKEREVKLQHQSEELNSLEQYTRRNSVRIYGVKDDNPRESTVETARQIIKLANDKLQIKISTADIDIAHRMGRFKPDANRPIICKFVSRSTKHEVIKARRNLKNTPVVIREDLTLKNAKLLETTSSHENVRAAWSDEGKIIALLQNNKKVVVDSKTVLSTP